MTIAAVEVWQRRATGETGGVKPSPDAHYRHRFPAEIVCQPYSVEY
jgi:hypothetical protein